MPPSSEQIMSEVHKDDPMRYFIVREARRGGQRFMKLVKEFKTVTGAWDYARRECDDVWLFAARINGPMHTNVDLFYGEEEAYHYTLTSGWRKDKAPHLRYYRTLQTFDRCQAE